MKTPSFGFLPVKRADNFPEFQEGTSRSTNEGRSHKSGIEMAFGMQVIACFAKYNPLNR